jgi:hypothetical protein
MWQQVKNHLPVKRHHAERYVLISLITFALTVVVVRSILQLTGYPRLGQDSVHIAHVLWGGLSLFASALLLLIASDRRALVLGAVLGGGGVGLFIDEVGKFITQNNNYFTPAALPIIYALLLLTVLVYLHVRRPARPDPRGEMYRALEQMGSVLEHRASKQDIESLIKRLQIVRSLAEDESWRNVAESMLQAVEAERAREQDLCPKWARLGTLATWLRGLRFSWAGLFSLGLVALLVLCGFLEIADIASPATLHGGPWETTRLVLSCGAALALIGGGMLFALKRKDAGFTLALSGLIANLTVINLIVLYQEQMRAVLVTAPQYVALGLVFLYRSRGADSRSAAVTGVWERDVGESLSSEEPW